MRAGQFVPAGVPQSGFWTILKTRTLAELAAIIRSKNAGPFRLTFDILFDEEPAFLAVAAQWDRTDTRPSRLRTDRRGERG